MGYICDDNHKHSRDTCIGELHWDGEGEAPIQIPRQKKDDEIWDDALKVATSLPTLSARMTANVAALCCIVLMLAGTAYVVKILFT